MAFILQAIVGSTTVNLTDGNPFNLLRANGMAGASVRRVGARGPAQHGDTDLGYRLNLREMELEIGFHATTDAILDGYRDTLMGIFKPLSSTPVSLKVTRDDGGVRQIDCYRVGDIAISLTPAHRPGHYHTATVRLRAPEAVFYGITPGTVTVTGTPSLSTTWYLAGGAIGSADVLMVGTAPAQGEAWTYSGTLGTSSPFTLAFRSGFQARGSAPTYAFYAVNPIEHTDFGIVANGTVVFSHYADYGVGGTTNPSVAITPGTLMAAGTHNYFVLHNPSKIYGGVRNSYRTFFFRGTVGYTSALYEPYVAIEGATRRWRSDGDNTADSRWDATIPIYALYNITLSSSQLAALDSYMSASVGGTVAQIVNVPYAGDLPEYPVVTIRGPITSPVITNTSTGDALDFGTIQIAAGTVYTIDTRYGFKTVTAGTVNKRSELTPDSDMATWHLAPSPIATGGTNTIQVTGTNVGTATQVSIVYYNRYQSF